MFYEAMYVDQRTFLKEQNSANVLNSNCQPSDASSTPYSSSAELRFARNPRLSLFIDFLPACVLDTMRHNLGP